MACRARALARGRPVLAWLALWLAPLLAAAPSRGTLLSDWPMLLAHDAGTTYLAGSATAVSVVAWTKTQPDGGFATLLDCGARALDVRTALDQDGRVVMHHGPVKISVALEPALGEVTAWAAAANETVLLYLSHFAGGEATVAATRALLGRLGPSVKELDAADLATQHVEALRAQGSLVLALVGLVEENYNSSIVCETLSYRCDDPATSAEPFRRLVEHLEVTAARAAPEGFLSMLQSHWQTSAEVIALGTLRGTSTLRENDESHLNAFVLDNLPKLRRISLLEVNNVCSHGRELKAALDARRQLASER
jgi:hypothetical protein